MAKKPKVQVCHPTDGKAAKERCRLPKERTHQTAVFFLKCVSIPDKSRLQVFKDLIFGSLISYGNCSLELSK